MLADAVCCCASGRWYFLFLDSLYFEGTVNNPAFLHASLNSTQTLQSSLPERRGAEKLLQRERKRKIQRVVF